MDTKSFSIYGADSPRVMSKSHTARKKFFKMYTLYNLGQLDDPYGLFLLVLLVTLSYLGYPLGRNW